MFLRSLPLALLLLLGTVPAAVACPANRSPETAYQRRDNNRCEGIRTREVSGSIRFIGYGSSPSNYGDRLSLRVPGVPSRPNVLVVSNARNYQLDDLSGGSVRSGAFQFDLPTNILRQARVRATTLRGLAFVNSGGRDVYYPLAFGPLGSHYVLTFFTPRTVNLSVSITPGNFSQTRANANGEISLRWPRPAQAGRYQLRVKIDGRSSGTFYLQHDSSWR